jgi:pheromone shutdown-related protein TraB
MPEVILVGTAHVSKESVREVRETILREKPSYVALELCEPRFEAITDKRRWENTPITELIKGSKAYFLLGYSMLSAFERKLGEKTGVRPGDEMLAGIEAAKKVGAEVVLVDRPIAITLKRAWRLSSFREKMRILKEFLLSIFGAEEITAEAIEDLKRDDVLSEMMKELARIAPSAKRVLIDERDEYIAGKLKELDKKTVAIVGKGHKAGIEKLLKSAKKTDFAALEEVPKKRFKWRWVFYVITGLTIGLLIASALKDPASIPHYWGVWIMLHVVMTAITGALSLAHPLSILAGAASSPITALLPTVGAGWVGGIVEAKLRKPTVSDFNQLRDLKGIREFWTNKFTHLLLVVSFINIGSMLASFVALPYLVGMLT